MDQPRIDTLYLSEDELQVARAQISEAAYSKWQNAGCPCGRELEFWLEAELEWVEYRYVPRRNPADLDLHENE